MEVAGRRVMDDSGTGRDNVDDVFEEYSGDDDENDDEYECERL